MQPSSVHTLPSVQLTEFAPLHVPLTHLSPLEHASPSSHVALSGKVTIAQIPVAFSHWLTLQPLLALASQTIADPTFTSHNPLLQM